MLDALFSGQSLWFTVPALVGTGVFLLRMLLMLAGGDDGLLDLDVEGEGFGADPGTDHSFNIVSIQTIFGFMMGFGWGGLLGRHTIGIESPVINAVIGIIGGIGMVWLMILLMKGLADLQASGNVDIDQTVGLEGSIYATVPPRGEGRGQVQLIIGNKQRMYWAVTEGEQLPTRSRVRVTKANGDNSVTVVKV